MEYLSARNRAKTETAQRRFKPSRRVVAATHLVHDPADQIPNRFIQQLPQVMLAAGRMNVVDDNHILGVLVGVIPEQGYKKLVEGVLHGFEWRDDWHGSPFPNGANFFRWSPDRSSRQFYELSVNFAKV